MRLILLATCAVVAQLLVVGDLHVLGVRLDIVVVVVAAAALRLVPERAAALGFGAGLLLDLFLTTPLGLTGFAYGLVGFGLASLWSAGPNTPASRTVPPIAAASGAAALVFATAAMVVGQGSPMDWTLLRVALVLALSGAILAVPVVGAVTLVLGEPERRRFAS